MYGFVCKYDLNRIKVFKCMYGIQHLSFINPLIMSQHDSWKLCIVISHAKRVKGSLQMWVGIWEIALGYPVG